MRFTLALRLPAPREALYAFLSDPAKRPRWQSSIRHIEYEPREVPGVGTRWRETAAGLGTFDMEVSAYDPPVRWAERIASKRAEGTVALAFAEGPNDAGITHLTVEVDIALRGLLRLVDPIAWRIMRREMRRDLERAAGLVTLGDAAGRVS